MKDVEAYETGKTVKEHGKSYTDNALILQSILRYSDKIGSEYFTSRELIVNHLIEDCKVYREMYSGFAGRTNLEFKVENIKRRIDKALNKLSYLEIVDDTRYIARNKEETKKYRFTKLGTMIQHLIFYYNTNDIKIVADHYEQIYRHICNYYASLNHAHAKFCLTFFKNCYPNGKFVIVIIYLTKLLTEASSIKDEFLFQIKFLNLLYWDLDLAKIYLESLNDLYQTNRETYGIVMLNIKLFIEERQESKAHYMDKFEVERHKMRGDIDMVVMDGFCNTCGYFYIASMKTIDYIKSLDEYHRTGTYVSKAMCVMCKKDYIDFEWYVD